ncbi:UNKNOWN [Stylonychia lemnae]|uniref:Uncharacterized protein n=1 Tax=Stylonychia lemnae TaxID=5949 RepID=A0A078B855_STYLE|nr:UNKNOWN [Stylonychia lemnae]|eukprot:CDW90584.1 UNKNOWN [Stylonychia lemnae]
MQLGNTSKPQQHQYLNFLEKQVEKSHKVVQDVNVVSEAVMDIGQRVDLIELGQQDLIKKFRILESIAMGSNDEQTIYKKTLDSLYLKVQDIEARVNLMPQHTNSSHHTFSGNERAIEMKNEKYNMLSQKLDHSLDLMERRINEIITKDFDAFMQSREQAFEHRVFQIIDAQAKDIAFDFTSLDQKITEVQEIIQSYGNGVSSGGIIPFGVQNENKDTYNLTKSTTNIERALVDLKREIIDKPDTKDLERFKRKIANDFKDLEKKIKDLSKPHISFDKDLKALENRLTTKLSKAIQRLGDIMKKQDRKLKGMIETSESRLQKQYSPISNKSSRNNRVFKSQHSLNISNTSMMRSLSPIKQDESRADRSLSRLPSRGKSSDRKSQRAHKNSEVNINQQQQQEYQSIQTNESAFRKYQSKFKNEVQTSQKKYIRSGLKQDSQESLSSLSPNGKKTFKRTTSNDQHNIMGGVILNNYIHTDNTSNTTHGLNHQRSNQSDIIGVPDKHKSQPLRRRDNSEKEKTALAISKSRINQSSKQNTRGKNSTSKLSESQSQSKILNNKNRNFDTPNFDLQGQSPQTFRDENSIGGRQYHNQSNNHRGEVSVEMTKNDISGYDSRLIASGSMGANTSIDRSQQLKVTNDRLAKLEKMYQELSQLEQLAKK